MSENREHNAIINAAERGVRRPLSNRIFRSIIATAITLGFASIVMTVVMFYKEYRNILVETGAVTHAAADAALLRYILIYLVLMTCVTLVIAWTMKKYTAWKIVEPIDRIAGAASEYITDKSDGTLDETHFSDLHIETEDELEHLSIVLRDMEHSMQKYVENLTRVTKEKERISTELDLARRIQTHMLPNVFPPYPNRKELDIFASMDPAKEVGGDFYDFFLLDDDHLGLVMADVSGKGIPAALFMMMARIMINSMALSGEEPGKVLESVNDKICENNEDDMFVTVWLGILTISTGHVKAVNAGHEYPIIRKKDGKFELMKDPHSFVVGTLDDMEYSEYEFTLEKGGTLFLYTDGLPEATKAGNEMFGTDRILESLNTDPDAGSEALLKRMTDRVAAFVGTAPQFDDLTMMAVRLNNVKETDPFESEQVLYYE